MHFTLNYELLRVTVYRFLLKSVGLLRGVCTLPLAILVFILREGLLRKIMLLLKNRRQPLSQGMIKIEVSYRSLMRHQYL